MKITELLKKLFPKPIIPQKRYALAFLCLIYLIFNSYLIYYERPLEKKIADEAFLVGLFLLSDATVNFEPDEIHYGETS